MLDLRCTQRNIESLLDTKPTAEGNTCIPGDEVVYGDSPPADLLAVNVCLGDTQGKA